VNAPCQLFAGTVIAVRDEQDGDTHVIIRPDPGYGRFLNGDNLSRQNGGLVTEFMPGQTFPIPSVGDHLLVRGTWVLDLNHGWEEIHPVFAVRFVSGPWMISNPVVPPLYQGGG
jgi:hypothetical protein